jgi:hypothetical protein
MKKAYSFLFLLLYTLLFAQVQFVNQTNQQPISNVTLLSGKGEIIGVSNIDGNINISEITRDINIKDTDTIEIYHTDFESQKIIWNKIRTNYKIYLNPYPVIEIQEIVFTPKSHDYLVLKGYFVSYQLIDNVPQSFNDGIIEYYINIPKEKFSNFNVLENRVFKNTEYLKTLYEKKGPVPSVGSNIRPFNFTEEFLLKNKKIDGIVSENKKIKITKNGDFQMLFVEYYTPEKPKEQSVLGIKSKILNYNISESFQNEISVKNLSNISKYYMSNISRKYQTIKYELIQNFYVLEKKYISSEEYKTLKFNNDYSTKYYSEFWKNTDFPKIPSFILDKLHKDLILIEKK